MLFRSISIAAAITLLSITVNAGTSGQIVQIVDSTNFCVFLPPTDSTDRLISDTEWDGQAFCMGDTPDATGANTMPSGFITSAHFVKETAYVQITGTIDPSKANLDSTDDGGQYDIKAPSGATCAGWDYFVNLIEPSGNTYCIRCCNDTTNCNRGISQDGCAHIIPGDYSGPSSSSSSSTTTASSSSTTTVDSSSSSESSSISSNSSSNSDTSSTENSSSTDSSITSDSTTTPSVAAVEPSSSPAVSTGASSIDASAVNSTPAAVPSSTANVSGTVSEQSLNSAGSAKPVTLTLGAFILASAIFLA